MRTRMQSLVDFYTPYVRRYPDGGGWPSADVARGVHQNAAASQLIPWAHISSVLDVGSGTGSFLDYLRFEKGYTGTYTGVEALESFHIQAVAAEYRHSCKWINDDFLSGDLLKSDRFDWSFVIGTLGTYQEEKTEHDLAMISKVAEKSNLGLTVSLNDNRVIPADRIAAVPGLIAHDVEVLVIHMRTILQRQATFDILRDGDENTSINVLFGGSATTTDW